MVSKTVIVHKIYGKELSDLQLRYLLYAFSYHVDSCVFSVHNTLNRNIAGIPTNILISRCMATEML